MTASTAPDSAELAAVHVFDADAPKLPRPVASQGGDPPPVPGETEPPEDLAFRRDRLLSGLLLIGGVGLFLALPFVLQAGAEFFMPLTMSMVIALMLVPLLEWLERRGLPSGVAALLAVLAFLLLANAILVMIVLPAADWAAMMPAHAKQMRANIAPILDAFADLERAFRQTAQAVGARVARTRTMTTNPGSLVEVIATSAPSVLVQFLFGTLVTYFFLSTWTQMRAAAIQGRDTLAGSLRLARLLRDVVSNTAAYLLTIASVNLCVGALLAAIVWGFGMPTPLMWGGLAALFNFIPYVGPIIVTALLALGGLITFADPWHALFPAAAFLTIHLIEANIITPRIVGSRVHISPLLILIGLSYWGWIWGVAGAIVSVPLLIMIKVVLDRVGWPDIFGFLFDGRTLTRSTTAPATIPAEPTRP